MNGIILHIVSPKYQVSVTSCNNVDGRHTKITKKSENAKLKINILTTVCICKLLQITKQTNALPNSPLRKSMEFIMIKNHSLTDGKIYSKITFWQICSTFPSHG